MAEFKYNRKQEMEPRPGHPTRRSDVVALSISGV